MTDTRKRPSEHSQFPSINKTTSNRKTDVFSEFENNRQLLRDDKDNLPKMKAQHQNNKQPQYSADEEDEYNQDFQPVQNISSTKNKKKGEDDSFSKKIQKKQQSNQKLTLERTGDGKNLSKHRSAKSAMQTSSENINHQVGRYVAEVDKKFGNLSLESSANDAIIKNSEQIREYIKKYNEILTDLINKNLAELTSKKKKKTTPEQAIRVLQQEIKNNTKVEQMDLAELGRLSEYKNKLEEQENYSETNLEQEALLYNMKIKQKKKEIYDMKLAVQNEAKKLVPSANTITTKNENQSEVTSTKEKLSNIRKEFQKNEQKINGLENRLNDLNKKLEAIGDVDKQADELRTSSKKTEDKNKKHQEVKKKYDALKAHVMKTDALWNTKCNVISHQNDAIRLKIKNIELQVKNMQEEAKLIYEKSMKTLNTTKPKNQQNQKNLDKILNEMGSYNESLSNKQMSLSQMKMLTRKKPSVDQLSTNVPRHPEKQDTKAEQNQAKTKSQQSQRNRVWKEQKAKNETIEQSGQKLSISLTEKNNIKAHQTNLSEKQLNYEGKVFSTQKVEEPTQSENKPKKFNFNKNKINQESKNDQISSNITQPPVGLNKEQHKNVDNKIENSNKVKQESKQNPTNSLEAIDTKTAEEEIKPKRFNLNLRERKPKEENAGYLPTIEAQQVTSKEQKEKPTESNQLKDQEKPTFNLRRKREGENKGRQSLDNEFMAQ